MATRYPAGQWDPLGRQTQPAMAAHDIVCLHTMAGRFDGTNAMFHRNGYGGTESHFGVAGDGRVVQWQDLDHTADANNQGNPRVISIETADMGESFPAWGGSNVPSWTKEQLRAIIPLVRWLCVHYNIPPTLIPDTQSNRRGIGYHRQGIPGNFPAPYRGKTGPGELWTVLPKGFGKPCPGDRRIRQTIDIVIPAVRGNDQEDDLLSALTDAEQRELLAKVRAIFDETAANPPDAAECRLKDTTIKVRELHQLATDPPAPTG